MIPDKHPDEMEYNDIEQILKQYDLYYEVSAHHGYINYEQRCISINPMTDIDDAEIVIHEALHHYYEQYTKRGARETFVRAAAKKIVDKGHTHDKVHEYINAHAQKIPSEWWLL